MHEQTFVPVHYQATAPLVLQPVMPRPMPSFSQASCPPRVALFANVTLARNDMVQGSVAAPMAG